jgi:rhodanese-related sulfurtransferase
MARFRNTPVDLTVDVRSKLEFWLGHLPGAVCIPVQTIERAIGERGIAKDARILVYCASGARSALALKALRALGYTRVIDGGSIAAARPEYSAS